MTAKFGAAAGQEASAATICGRRSSTATRPSAAIAKKEYMFPFVDGRRVPAGADARQDRPDARLHRASPSDAKFQRPLSDAIHIDRLNIGPIPTTSSTGCSRTRGTSSTSCSGRGRSSSTRTSSRSNVVNSLRELAVQSWSECTTLSRGPWACLLDPVGLNNPRRYQNDQFLFNLGADG